MTGGFFEWQKDVADLVLALTHLNSWAEWAAQNIQWLEIQVCRCSPLPLLLSLRMSVSILDASSSLPLFPHNKLSLLHRKLYFAQSHKPPYHGRVCVAPPGCLLSSSPDGPTKGILYVPSEKGELVRPCSNMPVSRESDLSLPSNITVMV